MRRSEYLTDGLVIPDDTGAAGATILDEALPDTPPLADLTQQVLGETAAPAPDVTASAVTVAGSERGTAAAEQVATPNLDPHTPPGPPGATSVPAAAPQWIVWVVALVSAAAFALAGCFATALQDQGWTPGATVLTRIGGSAILLMLPALLAVRGKPGVLKGNSGLIAGYGLFAIAGCQLCFFQALQTLDVGIALLIEYSSPLLLVAFAWARTGKRPGPFTVAGVLLAVAGLACVMDLTSAAAADPVGVAWASGGAVGLCVYFLLGAKTSGGLPPLALAGFGMTVAAVLLSVVGVSGLLPVRANTADVVLGGAALPWWVAALGLSGVSGACAYVTGIMVARALGPALASFVAYLELIGAFAFAFVLLGQVPTGMQFVGGAILLAGIAAVKRGLDADTAAAEPTP